MATYDMLIKGGTVVDGTGLPRSRADVGISDGRVTAVESAIATSEATEVLDASGHIVAPGFIDLHTHYDSQIQWDPYCTISGWHGVTSVTLGNCGFGFAPVAASDRDRAMLMMSRNEAISLEAMQEGMLWDWETLPEYMDSLDRIPKGVNCLTYVRC
jgi:N-acyl-D-aspartate/D-glutamate deacylase